MRSASLRQTARGLTRNQTTAWFCERGTVAQSAGGANRRGLNAWRSGHADVLTAADRAYQSPPEVSKQVSTQNASLTGTQSSGVCDAPLIEELACILNSQRALLMTLGDQNPHRTAGKQLKSGSTE